MVSIPNARATASRNEETTFGQVSEDSKSSTRLYLLPKASTLNSIIPDLVANRVFRRRSIPSLRQSISFASLPTKQNVRKEDIDPQLVTQRLQEVANEEEPEMTVDSLRPSSRDSDISSSPTVMTSMTPVPTEAVSGVSWEYASTGATLLGHANNEVAAWALRPRNPAFVRRLFIDAHGYFSDALPRDLTDDEVQTIRARLPAQVKRSMSPVPMEGRLFPPSDHRQSSLIRRSVARFTTQIILLFLFFIPLVRASLQRLHQLDRTHQVSERCIGLIIGGLGILWIKLSMLFGAIVQTFQDTPDTNCSGLLIWFTQQVTGGLVEGVNTGLKGTSMYSMGEDRNSDGQT